jgi:predicted O-linked N-acetylglucosamine transferase (SPINDLY family)
MDPMNRVQRRAQAKGQAAGSSSNIQRLFDKALRCHRASQLSEAERLYRQVLVADPRHADAWHLLGMIAQQAGRSDVAVELINKAIGINGTIAAWHSNLGNALYGIGRFDDAIAAYRTANHISPDFAGAWSNLGNALKTVGKFDDALAAYGTAIRLMPEFADAHSNLGTVLKDLGRLDEAVSAYRTAIRIRPNSADAHSNLGNALNDLGGYDEAVAACDIAIRIRPNHADAHANKANALNILGRFDEAIAACETAIRIRPEFAEAHSNLGIALMELGRLDDAITAFSAAIRIRPHYAEAHSNLGNALKYLGRFDDAVAAYGAAIRIRPDYAKAHINLGTVLRDLGRLDEGIGAYETAIHIKPDSAEAQSNLLMALHYQPGIGPNAILRTARRFAEQIEETGEPTFSHTPDPARRLRIGYVSADFHRHPVGYFLTPVLAHHDKAAVEVFCYSNDVHVDDLTARLRGGADRWRNLVGLTDQAAAALIIADGIDILVDLAGHTAGNRLRMFARKPAPVQVSWLGYFGTTGLTAMDYILADRFVAPEYAAADFTETIWRLPSSWLCFSPPDLECPILPPPVNRSGSITFGNFNNNAKTSAPAIAMWCRVLHRVPGSRLMLKTASLADATVRQRLFDQFAANGIAAERLCLETASPRDEYLATYNRVDIALDPMPFGGGTTTAEALWMGVPVVTLRGETWVGRMGESILSTIGLAQLVAANSDDYVETAVRLASDIPRLGAMRSELRSRIEASAFCDGARFTRNLEQAFRGMWHRWCANAAR